MVSLPTDPTCLPIHWTVLTWLTRTTITTILPCLFLYFCYLLCIGFLLYSCCFYNVKVFISFRLSKSAVCDHQALNLLANATFCSWVTLPVSAMVVNVCIIFLLIFHCHSTQEQTILLITCLILYSYVLPLLFLSFPSIPLPFHHFVYSVCSIGGILSFCYVVDSFIT